MASRPVGLRATPAVSLAERGLKNIHATLWAAGFNAPSEATVVWPQNQAICGLRPRHLGPKGAKKQSCSPAECENGCVLGGYGRLAPRLGKLRTAPAVPLAQRALKNNHADLRNAKMGTSSGATVVWPQGRSGCGLHPRHLGRKGAKKTFLQPCGLRDLARPWGRRSFGLKTKRFAGCIRGTLAERDTLRSVNEG